MMDDEVKRLAALDACAVSDALDSFGIQGVVLGLSAVSAPRRIAGRATTVQLGLEDGRTSRRHLCTAAVDASGPGTIIMISHGGRTKVAGWGGLLSLAASRNGVEGVVIDGACRDVDESRAFGLPVYASCAVPITARGRIIEIDWNVPVVLAGVPVAPGDLVIADGSGVVVIPQEMAFDVIAKAEAVCVRERMMAEAINAGGSIASVMGTKYENMLKDAPQ